MEDLKAQQLENLRNFQFQQKWLAGNEPNPPGTIIELNGSVAECAKLTEGGKPILGYDVYNVIIQILRRHNIQVGNPTTGEPNDVTVKIISAPHDEAT